MAGGIPGFFPIFIPDDLPGDLPGVIPGFLPVGAGADSEGGRIGPGEQAKPQRSGALVQCGSSSECGAGPSSSRPGARLPRASSKKSAMRFQKRARGG